MKFIIEDKLFDQFSPIIGVIVAENINNEGTSEDVKKLLHDEEQSVRNKFSVEGSLGIHPSISAWRRAYKQFGADSYRCSSEALVKRVLKGDSIPSINKLVDLYNLISLKYIIPVGGEDLDTMIGNLYLALADGGESFIRIGGIGSEPPVSGEVIYQDGVGVVCRRWNWREADRTKLTKQTHNAVIVVDGLAEIGKGLIEEATKELSSLVTTYCEGIVRFEVLDKGHSEMVLK